MGLSQAHRKPCASNLPPREDAVVAMKPSPPHRVPSSRCSGWQRGPCPHRAEGPGGLWSGGRVPVLSGSRVSAAVLGVLLSENRRGPAFSCAPRPQGNPSQFPSLSLHCALKGPFSEGSLTTRQQQRGPQDTLRATHRTRSLSAQPRGQAPTPAQGHGAGGTAIHPTAEQATCPRDKGTSPLWPPPRTNRNTAAA